MPLCILKTFYPRSCIECKSGIKRQCQEESIANAIRSWGIPGGSLQLVKEALVEPSPSWSNIDEDNLEVGERNVKRCKRKICDGYYTAVVRVLSSSGVAPYNDVTLEDLKDKHPLKPSLPLPHIPIDYHQLTSSPIVVLDMIKSFPHGTSCGQDGLLAQHLMDCLSGVVVAISDELVSSITQVVNLFLDGKCLKMLGEYIASAPLISLVKLGVVSVLLLWVPFRGIWFSSIKRGEAILHVVNHLIEDRGDEVGLSMLLVDFRNAFNLVDHEVMLQEVCTLLHPLVSKIRDSFNLSLQAWYLDDGTIIGDTLVVGEVLKVIIEDGPRHGLHLNVDKIEVFWPKEDPRSRFGGVFQPNIARPLHGVKLLGGPASVNFDFSSKLVMKRVAKSIMLMDNVAKLNDPQCKLLLLRACAVEALYLTLCIWRLGVYSACDVLNYAFLASRLQSVVLQSKLLRDSNIVTFRPAFDNALSTFNSKMEIDILSNPRDIYKDHDVSCTGIVSIKHRYNIVRDTLVDICFQSRISAGKEVDIGLGSSPLTQTGMIDILSKRAVTKAAQRERIKYEAKCVEIGYGFLLFSFSSFGKLERDALTLVKRIRKFSVTQDIGARATVHIFNRINLL
ncbi:hypothetical protein Tco_1416266 [Tanacetum coccineum]